MLGCALSARVNLKMQENSLRTLLLRKKLLRGKGEIYIVADVAVDAENLRITVIYKEFVTLGPTWSSYLEDFLRFNEPLENHKEETENE